MITRTPCGRTRVRPILFRHPMPTLVTKVYAVDDCKIAAMTADTGATSTYGSLVDVPGIKKVGITPQISTKELRGDNVQLEQDSTLVSVEVQVENAKLSLSALPILLGGSTAESGTTPNQKATYSRVATSGALPYFKLEAKTPTGGADIATGDLHIVVYKLKITQFDLGFAEEDYKIVSFTAIGVYQSSTAGKLMDIVLNETAAAIS